MAEYRECECGGILFLDEADGVCRCNNCCTEFKMPNNVLQHKAICNEMNILYERKNRDYGDSFHTSYLEERMAMARIRLGDKLNRFKTLTKGEQQMVNDESIRDTLMDLANYSIMAIMELDREAQE